MRILFSLFIILLTIQGIAQPLKMKSSIVFGHVFRQSIVSVSTTSLQRLEPLTSFTSTAQAVYAELGGTGGFLSLNYDTRLNKSNKGLGLRIGIGTISDLNSFGLTLPFGLNYLAGEKDHFFESALGATFFSFSKQNQDSWFSFTKKQFLAPYCWVGYRYQPTDKRFLSCWFEPVFGRWLKWVCSKAFPWFVFWLFYSVGKIATDQFRCPALFTSLPNYNSAYHPAHTPTYHLC